MRPDPDQAVLSWNTKSQLHCKSSGAQKGLTFRMKFIIASLSTAAVLSTYLHHLMKVRAIVLVTVLNKTNLADFNSTPATTVSDVTMQHNVSQLEQSFA